LLSWHGNTFGQRWFSRSGKQTTNLASVSKTTLRTLPVPLPPQEEQQRITAEVDRQLSLVDQLEHAITQNLVRTAQIRFSVLGAAFTGKLTEQDPGDEPASALLEQILAERPSSNGHKPSRIDTRRTRGTT
jgi:type I restriction enzyme S subunit